MYARSKNSGARGSNSSSTAMVFELMMTAGGIIPSNSIVLLFAESLVSCWVAEIAWKTEVDKDRKTMLTWKAPEHWHSLAIEIHINKTVCNTAEAAYHAAWRAPFTMQRHWTCHITQHQRQDGCKHCRAALVVLILLGISDPRSRL